jgi:O-acetyl-ADP-ribose deacetylase (regulator of RNase III)
MTQPILEVVVGDITGLAVDAIVNAANESLLGGGGVDGAIHRAAGAGLLAECRHLPELRPGVRCPTGEARITSAHALPARFVIHVVGPVWSGGHDGEPALLAAGYRNALRLACEYDVASVAFPAISCGVFGYPRDRAAAVAVATVREVLSTTPLPRRVVFCCFEDAMAREYRALLERS